MVGDKWKRMEMESEGRTCLYNYTATCVHVHAHTSFATLLFRGTRFPPPGASILPRNDRGNPISYVRGVLKTAPGANIIRLIAQHFPGR